MTSEILQSLFSNVWAIALVVLFFGGSIFVHELGHFLAARRRGVHVSRFSIGFGPAIFSWRGRDGVEYRLSWIPLGGYVALPQLADMRGIEGESDVDVNRLPPITYTSKMLVFVAGAVFNVLFAFVLATILWVIGMPVAEEEQTTRVGVVLPVVELPSGKTVPGPAHAAGMKAGDVIRAVDGNSVSTFSDLTYLVALGSGRGAAKEPKVHLTFERDGVTHELDVFPQQIGDEPIRDIGIEPATKVRIAELFAGSAAEAAGLKPGDVITHLDDQPVNYVGYVTEHLRTGAGKPVRVSYLREGVPGTATATPARVTDPKTQVVAFRLGVALRGALTMKMAYTPPWQQISGHVVRTWRTLVSLISPWSDIGLSKVSGPVGIGERFYAFAKFSFRLVLWFTILVNVNLAIFNLLPIPVLDGGHMFFATLARLRGRPLPLNVIMTAQSVFLVLLLSMIVYVSFFDVGRIQRDRAAEAAAQEARKAAAPTK